MSASDDLVGTSFRDKGSGCIAVSDAEVAAASPTMVPTAITLPLGALPLGAMPLGAWLLGGSPLGVLMRYRC